MADERRQAALARVLAHLEDAERLLEPPFPQQVKFALSRYYDHLEREDYERAWDELSDAGVAAGANPRFWTNLADGASLLGLEERRAEALRRARVSRA